MVSDATKLKSRILQAADIRIHDRLHEIRVSKGCIARSIGAQDFKLAAQRFAVCSGAVHCSHESDQQLLDRVPSNGGSMAELSFNRGQTPFNTLDCPANLAIGKRREHHLLESRIKLPLICLHRRQPGFDAVNCATGPAGNSPTKPRSALFDGAAPGRERDTQAANIGYKALYRET